MTAAIDLVLASASPRRKELLERLGLRLLIVPAEIDESPHTDERPADYVRRFLRHPQFDTQAKRMGVIARVAPIGIRFWRGRDRKLQRLDWR